uniref:head-tail joining protein n=1 Tax=Cupriavidus ulmosensis TaxID=3065913 RepID=UPI003F8593BD
MPIDWDGLVLGPSMKTFGEPVTYMPAAGAAFSITGVFDDAYLKEVMFEDASTGVTEVSAVLGIQLSQFPAKPLQSDKLSVLSVNTTYVVRDARPDSHGGMKLLLSKVSSP